MEIDVAPQPDASGKEAVSEALERIGARVGAVPAVYESAWRAAGLRDAVGDDEPDDYAFSPRSTRGATRA